MDAFEQDTHADKFMRYAHRGYIMSGGVLYRYAPELGQENPQLVVPRHEREAVLKEYHDAPTAGHYGAERTINRVAENYYWLGMGRQITEHTRGCVDCQRYKASNEKPSGLVQTPVMQRRFEVLCIDLFGPLVTSREGYRFILVVEDAASRWIELFPLRTATAEACAGVLMDEVLLRYGVCRRLISDNGPQFISAVVQQLAFVMGFKQNMTPVYHPEANMVERKNRDLKTQLAILVGNHHAAWPGKLPSIRFAMNSAKCASTGQTAAYLTFGRELRSPDNTQRDLRVIIEGENFASEIMPKLRGLTDTLRQAREIQEWTQDQRKAYVDQHRRPAPQYQPGDLVLVQSHVLSNKAKGVTSKLAPKRDGPYRVDKQVGPASYQVLVGDQDNTSVLYHALALTPYVNNREREPQPVKPRHRSGRPKKSETPQPETDESTSELVRQGEPSEEDEGRTPRRDAFMSEGGVCKESHQEPAINQDLGPRTEGDSGSIEQPSLARHRSDALSHEQASPRRSARLLGRSSS